MGMLKKAIKAWKDMKPPGFKDYTRGKDGKLLHPDDTAKAKAKKKKLMSKPIQGPPDKHFVRTKDHFLLDGVTASLRQNGKDYVASNKTSMKKATKGKVRKPLIEEMRKAYKQRAKR